GEKGAAIFFGGGKKPKYPSRAVDEAVDGRKQLVFPESLCIDFGHGICEKIHRRQFEVARNVAQQITAGAKAIVGVMAESFLQEGSQKVTADKVLTYGQSITDPCLSWEDTEQLLELLAQAVESRFK
ncbi:3-deoxy-7-phosphoheptulonate synthase, partial [Proteus mirabilis]